MSKQLAVCMNCNNVQTFDVQYGDPGVWCGKCGVSIPVEILPEIEPDPMSKQPSDKPWSPGPLHISPRSGACASG